MNRLEISIASEIFDVSVKHLKSQLAKFIT